ncbi:MAG: dipeptide epimerase [Gammaproteobacteria bacterium]|nr:dipeptide epimerase [Gammaproteobacteria bacterium]
MRSCEEIRLSIRQESWRVDGVFAIARGAQTIADLVVVELRSSGNLGHGECEPQDFYGESVESVIAQIESVRPRIEAGISRDELLECLPPGAARNAVDCAMWDLEAKCGGRSAWQIAGLPPRTVVTDFSLSLDTPEAMHRRALRYRDWPILKIKLGGGEVDVERVRAVREAAPNARLTADANESWTIAQLERDAPVLRTLGVELIEQPLPAKADAPLRGYQPEIPLCADEACHTRASLDRIQGLYQFVNIKLDKTGGLTEALALANEARARGLRLMVGCMTGTSLATAPALLVATLAEYVDLDGPLLLAEDRDPPVPYAGGVISPAPPALWG